MHIQAKFEQYWPYISPYWRLARMDRPIGWLLLLWPTMWSLFIASGGVPSFSLIVIFTLGVITMRSAGCVINDFADRKVDGRVERTKSRPLVSGELSAKQALIFFAALVFVALLLVLMTNKLTIQLAFGGLFLATLYPFMKRYTHLPQVVLGAAYAWSVPMAWAATGEPLSTLTWLIYVGVVLWTIAYDTFYAMVDRDDDLKIGVKSTAILFGDMDRVITGSLQVLVLFILLLVGDGLELGMFYYLGVSVAAGLFAYQQWLIQDRDRDKCFKAFLNNHYVGLAVFLGLAIDLF